MKTYNIPHFILAGLLVTLAQWQAYPATVALQSPTATYSQGELGDFSIGKTIDNLLDDNYGWAIHPTMGNQTACWETAQNIGYPGGSTISFSLIQNGNWFWQLHAIGRFRLSLTTDDRSTFADGLANGGDVTANWTVLNPASYLSANGATLTLQPDNSILASGLGPNPDTYIITAGTTLTGITGFRLEVLEDPSLPFDGPGRNPSTGNFILSEFRVNVVPEPSASCLFGMGLGVLFWFARIRKATARAS